MVNFQLFGLSQNLPVDDITTLDIEYQTEVFASLVNLNNVHKDLILTIIQQIVDWMTEGSGPGTVAISSSGVSGQFYGEVKLNS